jgi:hypothetical protein
MAARKPKPNTEPIKEELITITSIKVGYKKVVNGIDEAVEETGLSKDTILKHINSDMIAGYKFTK